MRQHRGKQDAILLVALRQSIKGKVQLNPKDSKATMQEMRRGEASKEARHSAPQHPALSFVFRSHSKLENSRRPWAPSRKGGARPAGCAKGANPHSLTSWCQKGPSLPLQS